MPFDVFKSEKLIQKYTDHYFNQTKKIVCSSGEINVKYAEGPFRYLTNKWRFLPHPDGCEIDFYVDFEFNSRLLQSVIETLFTEAVKRMVKAFEDRADVLYGRPAPRISGASATQS